MLSLLTFKPTNFDNVLL
jgi:uncharacterized protein YktB (UPF0637 family)